MTFGIYCFSIKLEIGVVIEDITSDKPLLEVQKKSSYKPILHMFPGIIQTFIYLLKTSKILFEKLFIKFSGRCYRWGIAYQFVDSWRDAELVRSIKIPNPHNQFLADPFVIYRNG